MSGLEQKAKTIGELNPIGKEQCCRGCYKKEMDCPRCTWNMEKWVRLEDARQEIDRLIEQRNIESGIVDRMQRERGEQKQKLQQFEEFLVAWTENDMKGYIYDYGKKNAHYYPSQDLDLVLDFFFGLREVLE